ncbi:bifunctional riboflavin kinase/FAD synthetase [Chitinophagaceae bacterium LWZ2-11]
MTVHSDLQHLPAFKNAVVTIGTFDGVHLGHQQIIAQLKAEAERIQGETVIITFHPHPRKIVSSVPGDIKLLNTLEEKIDLLTQAGIDHLVIVPFDHQFANMTAEEYIKDFLYKNFKPHTIIIGYDHRFGKGRSGDYHLLERMGEELGYSVMEISEQILHEVAISSTKIRNALLSHDITTANDFLGYAYFFEGTVVKGNQLGRTIGYPTANLHISSEEKLIPTDGVYAVEAAITDSASTNNNPPFLKGMMNIGLRPTVDGKKRVIEVNLFDFSDDIYDKVLKVYIKAFIRTEVKFNGLDALKEQLKNDALQAKSVL